jgi:hypothetical protein
MNFRHTGEGKHTHTKTYRVGDGRVEVEVVDDVLWLAPPALVIRALLIHHGGQDAVVVVVVEGLGLFAADGDAGQPLDHPPPDVTCKKRRWEK